MSDNQSYTFNGIKAILDAPSEKIATSAHQSYKNKTAHTDPLTHLLDLFVQNVKLFTESMPEDVRKNNPKINNAAHSLDQQISHVVDRKVDKNAVAKLLIEITIILIREFFQIKDDISPEIKQEATQLVQQATHIIELYQKKETELSEQASAEFEDFEGEDKE